MKLTSAQTWLIHSLEALALAAIVTAVAIVFPQAQAGTLTWQALAAGLLSAIIAVASKSGASILTNSQTAQALSDTVAQAVQAATPTPIVIHNNIPAAPVAQPAQLLQAPVNLAPVTAQPINLQIDGRAVANAVGNLAPPTQPQFIQPVINSTTAVQPLPSSGFTSLEMPAVGQG